MIRKGPDFQGTILLRKKEGAPSAEGSAAADFGYRLASSRPGTDDGVWASWRWDGTRLELRNDRLGFYPVFYFQDRGVFGASTSLAKLVAAGAPAALDDAAIAVFLRIGYYVGDDTPFKAILALPPAAALSWDSSGLRLEPGSARRKPSPSRPSRDAAVAEYGDLFQAAVERQARGNDERIALALTGGRDSRHILFALLKAGLRPHGCVTVRRVPPNPDEDVTVAAEVARRTGVEHSVLPRITDLLGSELEKNGLTNFCADEHAWILPLRGYLREHAFTAHFDGIGGDILSAGLYLNEKRLRFYEKSDLRELAEDILGPEGYLPHMLDADSYRTWNRELAVARVVTELEKHRGAANPVSQFFFWNRTRREIAQSPWGILNEPCHVVAPYLSEDVYDFLSALPASYFLDHSFHTETIARHYPRYADIPYETHALPPARIGRKGIARYAGDAARYSLLSGGASKRVNASFFLPRVVKGLIDADYGTSLHTLFNAAVYLRQLDALRAREAAY